MSSNLSRFLIKGFMKYSCREDLLRVLNSVKLSPQAIDCVLDYRHTPSGKWILGFNVSEQPQNITEIEAALSSSGISLKKLNSVDSKRMMVTSQFGITDRTICVHTVPPSFQVEHVQLVFDGYKIAPAGIRPWAPKRDAPTYSYLIDFASAAEAERACREKSSTVHDGMVMRVTWYNV